MRLLERNNDSEFSLTQAFGDDIPRYAILSHTWGADTEEVTLRDLMDGTGKSKAGYDKIRFCGAQARRDGLQYFWVDTCCIDKSSSAELSEAINSMFRWYRDAAKCYVYLSDVSISGSIKNDGLSQWTWELAFQKSRWFTRGWTLQELIAPASVEFFSVEGERLGDKKSLERQIQEITGINARALQGGALSHFSVDERMSWAARRETKREEDAAYSLLGIFDIHMPLIYGEGRKKALVRLQKQIKESHEDAFNHQEAEDAKYLQSLYASDYESHKSRNPTRVAGTCEWFLRHEKYIRWRQGQASGLLWVSGNPGCGKSVLSSFLVDELRSAESQATLPGTVCHFFFKDDNDTQKSAALALCALLHQLFTAKNSLVKHAIMEFRNKGQKLTSEFGSLWRILLAAAASSDCGSVMCVLDGLDECEESARLLLLDSLAKLYSEYGEGNINKNSLKFIVTSRPDVSIERRFYTSPMVRLKAEDETSSTSEDIERVVKVSVKRVGSMRMLSDAVQAGLEERLIKNADRTFLWVSLILEMIENSVRASKESLNNIISTIPITLDAAYDRILQRSSNLGDARKLLHIIVGAARPLTLEEMNVAFTIKPGDKSHEDLDLEPSIELTIKSLCGSFVRVIDSKIYLVHQTAKEYLSNNSAALVTGTWKHSLHLVESNLVLAEICILYLLFAVFESQPLVIAGHENDYSKIKAQVAQYTNGHDFLDYAAKNWAVHFRTAEVKENMTLFNSTFGICDTRSKRFLTWILIYSPGSTSIFPPNITDLMVASYFGHKAVARMLLVEKGADTVAKDDGERTALHWAAEQGHDAVVRLLLDHGAEVEARDSNGKTALYLAASQGHVAAMQILVEAEANVDATDNFGYNVLNEAAESGSEPAVRLLLEGGADVAMRGYVALHNAGLRGHERIVRLLRDKGVDVNIKGRDGWTALHRAALMNQQGVVQLLLDEGADVNTQDDEGGTALQFAAGLASTEVVQLLLNKGADITAHGHSGRTALHNAVLEEGREAVIHLLLAKGACVDAMDNEGRTPLHVAKYESAMRLLLEKGAGIEAKDKLGRSALHRAAENGCEAAVRLLLENGADVDAEDNSGYTPLVLAQQLSAWAAKEAVVCLLVAAGADIAGKTKDGSTALHWAADRGYEVATQLLLENGADIEAKDKLGQTALHRAVENGHEAAVRLLLEKGADVDAEDNSGYTPLALAQQLSAKEAVVCLLVAAGADIAGKTKDGSTALHWAAVRGYQAATQLLLEKGADVAVANNKGWTSLNSVSSSGHAEVVKLLLENGADATVANNNGWTSLNLASINGHVEVVKLLLEKGADVAVASKKGWTPLRSASQNGHVEVVRLLLDTGNVNTDQRDVKYGRTALSYAAEGGYEAVVKLLLADCAVDPNSRDTTGRTPLSFAAMYGHDTIVMTLLTNECVDPDPKDHYGSTPLSIAARNCCTEVVKMLLAIRRVDFDSRDCFGWTPLWWARRRGNTDIAQLLLENAKNRGIAVFEDEAPMAAGLTSDDVIPAWCDVCTLYIPQDEVYYKCGICNGGDFDICSECYKIGGRCLKDGHDLAPKTCESD